MSCDWTLPGALVEALKSNRTSETRGLPAQLADLQFRNGAVLATPHTPPNGHSFGLRGFCGGCLPVPGGCRRNIDGCARACCGGVTVGELRWRHQPAFGRRM